MGTSGTEQIFVSYQRKLGRRKICRAYLILKSYEYFVKDLPAADVLFEYLEHAWQEEAQLEDVCWLALLRYYSRQVELKKSRKRRRPVFWPATAARECGSLLSEIPQSAAKALPAGG